MTLIPIGASTMSIHPMPPRSILSDPPIMAGRPTSGWLAPIVRRRQAPAARSGTVMSADGTALAYVSIGASSERPALVYAHGFLGGKDHRKVPRFLAELSRDWAVYALDFRGHGASGGRCGFADGERADLAAVVDLALAAGHPAVLTVGSSMGAATAIRHAATCDKVVGVVSIGAYASAGPLARPSTQALLSLAFHRASGARMVRQALGARMGRAAIAEGQPVDLIGRIAPRPVLLIHGRLDPLIPLTEAYRLHKHGGATCDLLVRPWHGHDQPHLNGATARRIAAWARNRGIV